MTVPTNVSNNDNKAIVKSGLGRRRLRSCALYEGSCVLKSCGTTVSMFNMSSIGAGRPVCWQMLPRYSGGGYVIEGGSSIREL